MTLDEAIRRNPYNPKKGNEAAYCRYLRYNVDGWYQLDSKAVRRRWQKVRRRMQIVINIDDDDYDDITLTGGNIINLGVLLDLREAVRNGTPLPKGHGRLIDGDALYDQYRYADYDFDKTMEYAPTIIEADTAESEDDEDIPMEYFESGGI